MWKYIYCAAGQVKVDNRLMCIAWWINKDKGALFRLTVFSLSKRLHGCASMLRYMYISSFVFLTVYEIANKVPHSGVIE